MKLEEGMYAYSKYSRDYGIGKIVKIHTNGFTHQEVEIQYKDVKTSTRYDYVIGSFNPIDLIEEGDICTFDVTDIENYENYIGNHTEKIEEYELNDFKDMLKNESAYLISIVTKEQFESMSYKLGE